METELVTLKDAANNLRISPRTLHRLIAAGDLPTVQIGRRRLLRRETLRSFISTRETR